MQSNRLTGDKDPLWFSGMLVGASALTGFEFDANRPYTFCRVCGDIFQPWLDRVYDQEYTAEVQLAATLERQEWSRKHEKTHPSSAHGSLARSGRFLTPEAAQKLAPFGIVPLSDAVLDDESEHALLEAPATPSDDAATTK